jgi:hypothetical protein
MKKRPIMGAFSFVLSEQSMGRFTSGIETRLSGFLSLYSNEKKSPIVDTGRVTTDIPAGTFRAGIKAVLLDFRECTHLRKQETSPVRTDIPTKQKNRHRAVFLFICFS